MKRAAAAAAKGVFGKPKAKGDKGSFGGDSQQVGTQQTTSVTPPVATPPLPPPLAPPPPTPPPAPAPTAPQSLSPTEVNQEETYPAAPDPNEPPQVILTPRAQGVLRRPSGQTSPRPPWARYTTVFSAFPLRGDGGERKGKRKGEGDQTEKGTHKGKMKREGSGKTRYAKGEQPQGKGGQGSWGKSKRQDQFIIDPQRNVRSRTDLHASAGAASSSGDTHASAAPADPNASTTGASVQATPCRYTDVRLRSSTTTSSTLRARRAHSFLASARPLVATIPPWWEEQGKGQGGRATAATAGGPPPPPPGIQAPSEQWEPGSAPWRKKPAAATPVPGRGKGAARRNFQ